MIFPPRMTSFGADVSFSLKRTFLTFFPIFFSLFSFDVSMGCEL